MKELLSVIFSFLVLAGFSVAEESVNKELNLVKKRITIIGEEKTIAPPPEDTPTTPRIIPTPKFNIDLELGVPAAGWIKYTQGKTYPSKSKIKIHITANDDGYLYILNQDSIGNNIKELIHLSRGDNYFKNGEAHDLPSKDGYENFFELSGKGLTREALYVVYSKTALKIPAHISNIESVLNEAKRNSKQYIASNSINKELQLVPFSLPDMSKASASSFESKVGCLGDMCQVKLEFSHQ